MGMELSYILNQLGEERSEYFNAMAPPVIQTSNFISRDVATLRQAFTNEQQVHLYTRGNNPTVQILRKKIAALAGAEDALIFGSGVAAISAAVMAHVKAGDHVVCVQNPYSWTHRLLNDLLARYGVSCTMVDGREAQNFADATLPNTTLYYLETPNTFTFELQDIAAIVKLARAKGITTIADNSYATSLGQRCIEMGVDIEVHSATKYYGGHSDVVAGLLIGNARTIQRIFAAEFLNLGGIIHPHDAWLLLRSLRTLPVRMERIAKTTQEIVAFLENHPQVEKLIYPFSASHPQYQLAKKQMNWCGGLFTILLKATGVEQVELFCNSLRTFLLAVSWGGHESLVMPACSFYPSNHDYKTGYPFNMIRFYIGLEDAKFLTEDMKQAFAKIE